jgi:hypothetical protein
MRRAIFAIAATIAGLVALLSFKTHYPERIAAPGEDRPPAPGGVAGSAAGSPAPVRTVLPAGEQAVLGSVADTVYGQVQVQIVIRSGKIVNATIVRQPSATTEDLQIGQYAFPRLVAETITAQSARIDAVSGATYTSDGYKQSLQAALDGSGLAGAERSGAATSGGS